jgi:flagellar basal-body rod protein FlgB
MMMLTNIFQGTTIPVLQEVVHFAQARHEVLAGNVANIDTPGYKTADISPEVFQHRLRDAIEDRKSGGRLESAGAKDAGPGDPLRRVRDSLKTILRHDESDVSMEQQVIEMTENQFMHNMAITLMTSQFRLLEAAVSERI